MSMTRLFVDTSTGHGAIKHRRAAPNVHKAIALKGVKSVWENHQTGRRARLCEIEPGLFGIQIIQLVKGEWVEVTSFIKSKQKRIEQVEQYLRNSGYQPIR